MTKVALIFPGKDKRYAIQEPLNIGFLASYLEKHGVDVIIIDQLAGQDVKKEIEDFGPDIVGITGVTPVILDAYEIADMCREMGILTVMGGVHVTALPEEALQHCHIAVIDEGEIALLEIVKEFEKGNVKKLYGKMSRPFIRDIDEVPAPARHLMKMDFYLYTKDRFPESWLHFVPPKTKIAEIITSRGCPHQCIFCRNSWRMTPVRFNSAERVVLEIEDLIENYGVRHLFFIDDNLFTNKDRLRKICKLIKDRNIDIEWGANSRVDTIDDETLQLAKEAGCRQVTFGFESGSQRILDVLNKRTTVEQSKKAIKMCKEKNLIVNGTFIIGNPTETIEDIKVTQKFIAESDIDYPGVGILTAYPGTKLWKLCEERNLIPEELNWENFIADRVAIPCNTIIPKKKIEQLLQETNNMIVKKRAFKSPVKTFKEVIKYPSRVTRFIKQNIKR